MARDDPESLWLFGELEPWRRGRNILLTIAAFYATVQTAALLYSLFNGGIEIALVVALSLVIW